MKKIFMIMLISILSFGLIGCRKKPKIPVEKIYYYELDITFGDLQPQIWLFAFEEQIDNNPNLKKELSSITNELDRLYSATNDESLLSKVNDNSGVAPVKVNQELIDVLKAAKEVSALSKVDGVALYDVSILPVVDLWDINNLRFSKTSSTAEPPADEEIKKLLPLVDYENIIIDEDNLTIYLSEKGMKIDLGSILKGYAADKIKAYLNSLGFENGLVNVAGNLYAMGKHLYRGKFIDWEVAIHTPYTTELDGDKNTFGSVTGVDYTAVTSGSYERFILAKDGTEYHHILDPRTGYPNNSDVVSVTIVTKDSMRADALSTAAFSMGLEKGYELIESLAETEAVFLTTKKEVYVTSGLVDNFNFNNAVKVIGYEYKGVKNGTSD